MFDIQSGSFGRFKLYTLINTQSGEYVSIVPECGANITEIVLKSKDILLPVLSGYKSGEDLLAMKGYHSARLLPFPNRINDGKYEVSGNVHQLAINREKEGHAIHGLFYDQPFAVDQCTSGPESAVLTIYLNYDGSIDGYPFPFLATLTYSLTEGGLTSELNVLNIGTDKMPFGDGWHPYFSFDQSNGSIDKLQLRIPCGELLELNSHKIPTGATLPFNLFNKRRILGDIQLDIGLHLDEGEKVVTELYDASTNATLGLWQATGKNGYNYLQIYTPPARDSIAIEPMTCAPDAFNNGMGLIILEPGESFDANYGVCLD